MPDENNDNEHVTNESDSQAIKGDNAVESAVLLDHPLSESNLEQDQVGSSSKQGESQDVQNGSKGMTEDTPSTTVSHAPSIPAAASAQPGPSSTTTTQQQPLEDTAVPVEGPYRRNKHRIDPANLPKGILKPAPVVVPRFSFRRDVLSYVVGGEATTGSSSPSTSYAPAAQSQSQTSGPSAVAGNESHGSTSRGISNDASAHTTTPVAATTSLANLSNSNNAKGAFWRRLGGAMTAVAAQVPVPQAAQRTLHHLTERQSFLPQSSTTSQNGHSLPSSSSTSSISANQAQHQHHHADNPAVSSNTTTSSHNIDTGLDSIKSVRFTMSSLTVVYPINSPAPPGTEAQTRKRVNREYRLKKKEREGLHSSSSLKAVGGAGSSSTGEGKKSGWTGDELCRLYDECCRTREEPGIDGLRRLLMDSAHPPKVIDLKGTQLSKGQVEVLSDVLSVEFGLKKLILEDCGLDDDSLKPLIHSLLVSATLPTLSLANNKRIRAKGWRLISLFVKKATALRYLDISDNLIDKKAAEGLVDAIAASRVAVAGSVRMDNTHGSAETESSRKGEVEAMKRSTTNGGTDTEGEDEDLPPTWAAPLLSRTATKLHNRNSHPPSSQLSSLRLESCSLKNPTLETLANGIRQSEIKHISLRRNKINNLGAVALAVMIRDYELPGNEPSSSTISGGSSGNAVSGGMNGLFGSVFSPIQEEHSRPGSPSLSSSHGPSASNLPLTQRTNSTSSSMSASTSTSGNSVTARLEAAAQAASHRPLPPVPPRQGSTISHTSLSSQSTLANGTTTSHDNPSDLEEQEDNPFGPERNRGRQVILPEREAIRHAEMKARLKKQIDALPRVGSLLTLDVRSNEIRGGVTYIAQVLKRNRTLKVLNLSDNKIDSQGLNTIAEALKYNSTLETLDLSNNPCCGPSLEGINTLRTAFAFNNSLLRIFLTNTDFSTSAAISLAEFLPEVHSLIHLDLTDNPEIEIAGIMALAASVKLNTTLRCLDLSIPPNDPEYARLSQDILQSCIRNTELAQEISLAKYGIKKENIAQPIYKSEIANQLREFAEIGKIKSEKLDLVLNDLPESWKGVVDTAKECIGLLVEVVEPDEERKRKGEDLQGKDVVKMVLDQAYAAESQLAESMTRLKGDQKDAVGQLGSRLAILLQKADGLYKSAHGRSPSSGSFNGSLSPVDTTTSGLLSPLTPIKSPASPSQQLPSPSFSITDSDDEDEESEIGSNYSSKDGRTPPTSPRRRNRPTSLEIPPLDMSSPADSEAARSLPRSPVESHSRVMVLEEGEVFRKSTSKQAGNKTLLDVLDDDDETGNGKEKEGEELRQEILETRVEKTRRTSLTSEELQEAQLAKEVQAKLLHEEQASSREEGEQ